MKTLIAQPIWLQSPNKIDQYDKQRHMLPIICSSLRLDKIWKIASQRSAGCSKCLWGDKFSERSLSKVPFMEAWQQAFYIAIGPFKRVWFRTALVSPESSLLSKVPLNGSLAVYSQFWCYKFIFDWRLVKRSTAPVCWGHYCSFRLFSSNTSKGNMSLWNLVTCSTFGNRVSVQEL